MSEIDNTINDEFKKNPNEINKSFKTFCDICVTNRSSVTLENIVARYWQANSITGTPSLPKTTIANDITLERLQSSDVVANVEYDTTPNPRNDHWSLEFYYSGKKYIYKDKRCNITKKDANQLVTMLITGNPKKGFTFHVDMPVSSSCSGKMD